MGTESFMDEIKTEDVYENYSKDGEGFDFSNYSAKSKHYDNSSIIVVDKIKFKTSGLAIKEWIEAKDVVILGDDSSEHKSANSVNKNEVETITYSEYKDVLLNKKCLRYLMNRIQN